MIGIFINIIVLLTLVATLGYSALQFSQGAERSTATHMNVSRMADLVATLRGNSTPLVPGGVPRLPAPMQGSPYEGAPIRALLPTEIVGDDRTGWGARYGYCPLALPGGAVETGSKITLHGGGDYEIEIATQAGRDFVVAVEAPPIVTSVDGILQPRSVMGYVVSPALGSFDIPRCDEIIYRDGAYVIGKITDDQIVSPTFGGTVTPIMGDRSILSYVPTQFTPTVYVSETGSGVGSGRSAADAMDLAGAVLWWQSNQPPALIIEMATGSYDATGLGLDFISPRSSDQLAIRGVGETIITGAGNAMFNQQIEIDSVSFGEGSKLTAVAGARMRMSDVSAGVLVVSGGEVTLLSNSTLIGNGNGHPAIDILSGRVALADSGPALRLTAQGAPAIIMRGGTLEVASDIQTSAPLLWSVQSGNLTVGRKADGTAPKRNGANIEATKTVTGPIVSGANAEASCPAEQPYVVNASCSSDRGALRSSFAIGGTTQGWSCFWADDPAEGASTIAATVIVSCSAAPAH